MIQPQMWPTNSCCRIQASRGTLTIAYPKPRHFPSAAHNSSTKMILHISCLPFFQLNNDSFIGSKTSLPGLDLTLSGNVADKARRTLTFDKSHKLHGAWHYRLAFDFSSEDDMVSRAQEPVLVLGIKKTKPGASQFVQVP